MQTDATFATRCAKPMVDEVKVGRFYYRSIMIYLFFLCFSFGGVSVHSS